MPKALEVIGLKEIKNLIKLYKFAENISLNKICSNCYNNVGESKYCIRWLGEAVGRQWMEMPLCNTCEDWKKA